MPELGLPPLQRGLVHLANTPGPCKTVTVV
jgi:hypothetical protein